MKYKHVLTSKKILTVYTYKLTNYFQSVHFYKFVHTEAADSMEISRDEVFGPIMNVYKFNSEQEVVERANNSELGLASGLFTKFVLK